MRFQLQGVLTVHRIATPILLNLLPALRTRLAVLLDRLLRLLRVRCRLAQALLVLCACFAVVERAIAGHAGAVAAGVAGEDVLLVFLVHEVCGCEVDEESDDLLRF